MCFYEAQKKKEKNAVNGIQNLDFQFSKILANNLTFCAWKGAVYRELILEYKYMYIHYLVTKV